LKERSVHAIGVTVTEVGKMLMQTRMRLLVESRIHEAPTTSLSANGRMKATARMLLLIVRRLMTRQVTMLMPVRPVDGVDDQVHGQAGTGEESEPLMLLGLPVRMKTKTRWTKRMEMRTTMWTQMVLVMRRLRRTQQKKWIGGRRANVR
jgi:hypothetical protein